MRREEFVSSYKNKVCAAKDQRHYRYLQHSPPWWWRQQAALKRRSTFKLRTRQHIPEDSELHTRRRENLKSHIRLTSFPNRLLSRLGHLDIASYMKIVQSNYKWSPPWCPLH